MTGDFQNRLKNRDDPFAVEFFFGAAWRVRKDSTPP